MKYYLKGPLSPKQPTNQLMGKKMKTGNTNNALENENGKQYQRLGKWKRETLPTPWENPDKHMPGNQNKPNCFHDCAPAASTASPCPIVFQIRMTRCGKQPHDPTTPIFV